MGEITGWTLDWMEMGRWLTVNVPLGTVVICLSVNHYIYIFVYKGCL